MKYTLEQRKNIIDKYKKIMPYNKATFDKQVMNDDEIINNMQQTIVNYSSGIRETSSSSKDSWKLLISMILTIIIIILTCINFYLIFVNALPNNFPNNNKINLIFIVVKVLLFGEFNALIFTFYLKHYMKYSNSIVEGILTLIALITLMVIAIMN